MGFGTLLRPLSVMKFLVIFISSIRYSGERTYWCDFVKQTVNKAHTKTKQNKTKKQKNKNKKKQTNKKKKR